VDDSGSKADADRLQQLLSILQVSPAQILVVGDAATDVEVAHHLGAQGCIGFGGGWTLPLRLESVSVMIHQLSELKIGD
jgi:phosphoglycolate phosphatase-like HAD superfamily hydrolase